MNTWHRKFNITYNKKTNRMLGNPAITKTKTIPIMLQGQEASEFACKLFKGLEDARHNFGFSVDHQGSFVALKLVVDGVDSNHSAYLHEDGTWTLHTNVPIV